MSLSLHPEAEDGEEQYQSITSIVKVMVRVMLTNKQQAVSTVNNNNKRRRRMIAWMGYRIETDGTTQETIGREEEETQKKSSERSVNKKGNRHP